MSCYVIVCCSTLRYSEVRYALSLPYLLHTRTYFLSLYQSLSLTHYLFHTHSHTLHFLFFFFSSLFFSLSSFFLAFNMSLASLQNIGENGQKKNGTYNCIRIYDLLSVTDCLKRILKL